MDSKRQLKFARLIQKDLGEIFQHDTKNMFDGVFVSVTEVAVSPDLGYARAYLSIMLADNKQEIIKSIRQKTKVIRQILSQKIKHQVRVIPQLQFFLDDTAEYAAKMDAIFATLHIPDSNENGSGNPETNF